MSMEGDSKKRAKAKRGEGGGSAGGDWRAQLGQLCVFLLHHSFCLYELLVCRFATVYGILVSTVIIAHSLLGSQVSRVGPEPLLMTLCSYTEFTLYGVESGSHFL